MYAPAPLRAPLLHVSLDSPLPPELAVGRGTALFVIGTCYSPESAIRSLEIVVDGDRQPVMAHGMPRLDFFRDLHPGVDPYTTAELERDPDSVDDPHLLGYRSGFWGLAMIAPRPESGEYELERELELELELRAELGDGRTATAPLSRIALTTRTERIDSPPFPADHADPPVAICIATHNPPLALLQRQLDSIREQTHTNWVCVISDDSSGPDGTAAIDAAVAGDPRFVVSRAPRRLGFYRNFERALSLAPPEARYVAMGDQDDAWYPAKLEVLIDAIGQAQLVYSDARIVDPGGRVLAESYWSERHNNHTDLLSLLVANAVTGAASLFRADLLDYALPFPPAQFAHYHDHWIGLVALCRGEIAYVERPLYDYVQHSAASLGHATATRMVTLRERLARRRGFRERARMWRLHYFADVCRLLQFATVLQMRCAVEMEHGKRRVLERFLGADRSLTACAKLGIRGIRELTGATPETLGAEWMLFLALTWRRLLVASARDRPQQRLRLDAVPPPSLIHTAQASTGSSVPAAVAQIAEKIAPLDLVPTPDAPARVNLLIPTIDLEHFFGGYIGKFNLARRLAEHGIRVRLVTVDPVPALPPSWKKTIESYGGLAGVFDRVEVAFGRGGPGLDVSPEDRFIATTWWTAHIAERAARSVGERRFLYLIQEYEPFTFPMGTFAALAEESYRFPHFAVFSSELLRDYFRRHRIGVFQTGTAAGDRASMSFQNAITSFPAPTAGELAARAHRRLLFYARPEAHAARNMFELGVLALARALERGAFDGRWELNGIGAVSAPERIALNDVVALNVLPRTDQRSYAQMLRDHDLGLALMYTPHPSLVPIEMAAAGMITVTNSFENKTADAMAAISGNLVAAEPSITTIASALQRAASAVEQFEARSRGAEVNWSRDWDTSFDEALLARIGSELVGER